VTDLFFCSLEDEGVEWEEVSDPSTGEVFFFNHRTEETTWDPPPGFYGPEGEDSDTDDEGVDLDAADGTVSPHKSTLVTNDPCFVVAVSEPQPLETEAVSEVVEPRPSLKRPTLKEAKALSPSEASPSPRRSTRQGNTRCEYNACEKWVIGLNKYCEIHKKAIQTDQRKSLLDAIDIEKLEIAADAGEVAKEEVVERQKKSLAASMERDAEKVETAAAAAAAAAAVTEEKDLPAAVVVQGWTPAPQAVGSLGLAGYLVKRAVVSGTDWKRRFFVARNDSLKYYRTKQDYDLQKPAKGVFHLTPGATITPGIHESKLAPGTITAPPKKPKRANNAKKLPPPPTIRAESRKPKFAIAHGSNARGKRVSVLLTKADRYV
jgi:hypothetical protein